MLEPVIINLDAVNNACQRRAFLVNIYSVQSLSNKRAFNSLKDIISEELKHRH